MLIEFSGFYFFWVIILV